MNHCFPVPDKSQNPINIHIQDLLSLSLAWISYKQTVDSIAPGTWWSKVRKSSCMLRSWGIDVTFREVQQRICLTVNVNIRVRQIILFKFILKNNLPKNLPKIVYSNKSAEEVFINK